MKHAIIFTSDKKQTILLPLDDHACKRIEMALNKAKAVVGDTFKHLTEKPIPLYLSYQAMSSQLINQSEDWMFGKDFPGIIFDKNLYDQLERYAVNCESKGLIITNELKVAFSFRVGDKWYETIHYNPADLIDIPEPKPKFIQRLGRFKNPFK